MQLVAATIVTMLLTVRLWAVQIASATGSVARTKGKAGQEIGVPPSFLG